ncbi:hypothetical protein JHK87_018025 [Glycine soja]|nr:hypothetical protein JHK87_018025 [Glycine soja]
MNAIKMEGGLPSRMVATKAIVEAGIVVIGHVGLTPHAISVLGGFRPQGKNVASVVKPFKFLQLELGLDPFAVDKLVGLIPILENVLFLACTFRKR